MSETANAEPSDRQRVNFVSLLSVLQSILAAGGLVLYVALNLAYARFYDRLGLSPDDVGLGYASTLIRSSGLLLLVVTPLFLTIALFFIRRRPHAKGSSITSRLVVITTPKPYPKRMDPWLASQIINFVGFLMAAGIFFILGQVARLPEAVSSRVEAVKQGREVTPLRVGSLTILDVTATQAHLQWINKPSGSPDLSMSRLLYLGQANGQFVLYDAGPQQNVIKLPSGSAVLIINNCAGERQADGSCPQS
jgi:hypothetical protein